MWVQWGAWLSLLSAVSAVSAGWVGRWGFGSLTFLPSLLTVTGMAGLAGLKKDIDQVRADTNQSLLELRGLLGEWDLGNYPEMGGMAKLAYCTNPWERFSLQSILFPDCSRVTCPEGWLAFEGRCYYFSPNTKSWDEARKFCQENYSHLVIINSVTEQVSCPLQAHENWQGQPASLPGLHILSWPRWSETGIAFELLKLFIASSYWHNIMQRLGGYAWLEFKFWLCLLIFLKSQFASS